MTGGRPSPRRFSQLLGVLWCRYPWTVIVFWLAATAAAMVWLPSISQQGGGALGALAPKNASAVQAEVESATRFAFPLLSRTTLVQRDPHGRSVMQQARAIRLAEQLTRHTLPGYGDILGALTVTNSLGVPPFSREHSTTMLTYLFFKPHDSAARRATIAHRLLRQHVYSPPGGIAGVTGEAPAHVQQRDVIHDHLGLVELATVLLVAIVLGARFRALGAPVLALGTVGVAYVLASHVVAWVGRVAGLSVPQEVEPVMVVLILGVVTDYTIFFLARFRENLGEGLARDAAAERTARAVSPIVLVAGLTVIAATAALLVAHLTFFRVFGPGLAVTVATCVIVVLTFVPAVLAAVGSAVYWPWRPSAAARQAPHRARHARARTIAFACGHPRRAVLLCLVVVAAGASGLYDLRLSNPVVRGLPPTSGARGAYRAATRAFAPGVVSPTVVLVNAPRVGTQRAALARLQALIAAQPGIALVLGAGDNPLDISFGAALATSGNAARYFVVLDSDPLSAQAISTVRHLQKQMPGLLKRAGLPGAQAAYAGDTALSAETINDTLGDLGRIAPVSLAAMLLILIIYLRALVAPLYLVAASMLSFAAALGITAYVFQGLLGEGGLSFFVPFIAAVL
ncbi:MAG TPA: MMPL family transporter, partial [Solirubrobacteraceae bacterium]|nr:MMPL family transporter [Solirubrobacteraceae bacterium]